MKSKTPAKPAKPMPESKSATLKVAAKPSRTVHLVNRDKIPTLSSTKAAVVNRGAIDAQREIAEARAKLAAIGRAQAVIEFTLDGRILDANENFLATVGYSLDEIRGQHHSMFVDATCRSSNEYRMFWDKLGRGEYDAGQYQRYGKGGKEIWLEASYNPLLDLSGKPFKVVKYATNITAQVHAANALRLSAEQAQGVLLAAGKGDLAQRVPMEGKSGEMKALCEGINAMLDHVSEAKQREQKLAAETARIKQGLDVVVTNVMIADADLNVVYVNHSIKEMLVVAESDIRKDVPSFNAANVIGTNIDTFHKKPSYQRNMLASMTSTHNAKLVLGGRTFSLILNPINGAANERLGYVVEWKDMTAELAAAAREQQLAAETARVKQGLDVVVTNVMIADADLNVVYVNHSIKEMLVVAESDIRKDVPSFSAARVIGTNIDTFHKKPSYQRNMLANMTSTHNAKLVLGGRTFSLILNPINGAANERLGYVVEWKDMTAELAAAAREAERQALERKLADENLRIKNALDNVSSNVMIANNERDIVYMNSSVMTMMVGNEAELRKTLPSFDTRKLIGGTIDQFHKNPAHQMHMLAALRSTHRAEIKVGGLTFGLIANPIVNDKGERLGTVVEWKDRTLEVSVENEIASIVGAAANGDFTQRIEMDGKDGFFKMLGDNLNQLLETSSLGLEDVVRVLSALAKGDLTETISNEYHGTFGQMKDDANATVAQLTEIITQIKVATDTINTAAKEIASGNSDLSSRTEQQAASLEETASSMEELTSTVKQNAENAKQANQLAVGASEVARKGGQVVSEVVTTMSAINESSKKIVDIISVIDGIAFQTNILALNAAVEAARAGEQGRGFAVVAAEVRSLAQRSAGAAKEIKTLIGDSVEKVGNGSKLVEQAGRTMEEIVTSVKRVTDIMAEISAASQEQSQGIEQVNQTVTQMDEVTQQNAALVEEASAAARSLEEQAGGLLQSVSQFKLEEVEAAPVYGNRPPLRAAAAPARPALRPVPRPAARPVAKALPAPVRKPLARPAVKASGGDKGGDQWSEF
ncbi:MAG: methyl-accepting chemotaxis protein [Nevskia sp.]|nr:methyl-accepting chemotaxis protein [Nevskia sp.]